MNKFTGKLKASLVVALLALGAASALAQKYPNKVIEWVVPYPPGGGTDTVARTLAQVMGESLGQPMVINNKPGAATNIGAEYVARAKNDGYVIMSADTATLAANPFIYSKLPFHVEKDFAAIGLTVRFPMILVVNPAVPASNLKELLQWMKTQDGSVSYATPGAGSPHHLASELFREVSGTKLTHIPYKGAAPALQDVVGGQVPMMFVDTASGYQFITSGKLRPIGIASAKRVKNFENIPTLAEQGLKNFEAYAWQGLLAPAGTPEEVIQTLNKALMNAMNNTQVKAKLQVLGLEATPSTPQAMADYAAKERAKWGPIIKATGIKAD
ncbi:ABC transporter substrate-binding protein [Limnohabitans sp. TS-CS-82]|uniref:Bug family tripartite tricarboxylate transporter substrate binding protein n=1 Tax=Limnohabitans sp. TS-CS-82 TaxID=2094193 RepID=UPI000CF2F667|nr:tripartite tricarboxylate transporter substrate binding protein [Limnohabitans sp. TS-CS-82]PQA83145.1 ABC transporter substrate-binding protein [Limnohabitans sp. TS-CS-82]